MVTNYSNNRNTSWTQQEFDAFVSLAYNAGTNVSYVMDKILNGFNPYDAFSIIRYSSGTFALGLYRRRMDEADIFVSGTYQKEYLFALIIFIWSGFWGALGAILNKSKKEEL
jgi:GH24 family phage-related lysozyme (muramidase)